MTSYLDDTDEARIVGEHVEANLLDDDPDLVIIQVYITNAKRADRVADHYRAREQLARSKDKK